MGGTTLYMWVMDPEKACCASAKAQTIPLVKHNDNLYIMTDLDKIS